MTNPDPQLDPNTDPVVEPSTSTPPGNLWHDLLLLFFGSGTIIALDFWTKELVAKNLLLGESWLPDWLSALTPYARIIHLQNRGTAFGLFRDQDQINLLISIIAIAVSLFIVYYFPKIEKKERALRIALILQLAGAVGNLISRIRYGYVLDFISVGDFPVFNIADSSITIGLVVLIIGMLMQEWDERKKTPPAEQDGAE